MTILIEPISQDEDLRRLCRPCQSSLPRPPGVPHLATPLILLQVSIARVMSDRPAVLGRTRPGRGVPVSERSAESGLAPCFRKCAAIVLLQICCPIFFFFFVFGSTCSAFTFWLFGLHVVLLLLSTCFKNKSLGVSSLCFLSDPSPPGAQFAGSMSQGWLFLCLDVLVSRLLLSRDSLTSSSPRDPPPPPPTHWPWALAAFLCLPGSGQS